MKNSEALTEIFAMNDWSPSIWARKSGFSLNQIIRWQKGLTKNIRPNNLVQLAWIVLYKVDWLDPQQTECEIYPFSEEDFVQRQLPREFTGSNYELAKGKSYIPILTLRQINRGIKGPGDQRQWIADDVMLKPAGLEDNQAYAVLVAEKPILPILKQFSRVVVDTLSEVKSGDLVVIKLIDEPTLIAEYSCENDNVILKHYNGGESTCYEKEIQFKHKIVWIKMP